MNKKISIIVPIYNAETLLPRCLDSIFAQTSQDYEVVAVDDGSTDTSLQILLDYSKKHSKLRVVHYDLNEGLAVNRIRGISAAKYDYIIFVDSDDTINPNLISRLITTLNTFDCDLIRFKACLVDDQPWKDHERFNAPPTFECISGVEALKRWSIPGNKYALFWMYCFKKSLFEKFEIPNFRYNEDMCSVPFLILHSKSVMSIDYVGYNYTHSNPLSMTNDKSEKAMKYKAAMFFRAYDFIISGFKNFPNLDEYSKNFFIDDFKKSLTKKFNSFSADLKVEYLEMYNERINS